MSLADATMQVLAHCRTCDRELSTQVPAVRNSDGRFPIRCRECRNTANGYVEGHGPRYDGPDWFRRGEPR